jgi:ATP-dependent DNA helicase RecQ
MTYSTKRGLDLLRLGTGNQKAEFRVGQEAATRHVVEGKGRLLVVQKTGWGKSFVYFIATKILREAGNGPALLVSPLLSLMRDQIRAAGKMGVKAVTITSANQDNWDDIEEQIAGDKADIILISPERLANQRFGENVLANIAHKVSLLVVDEAHCISDWGHEFRPQYRLIERIIRTLPPNLRLLATTATANNRVMEDLSKILGPKLTVMRGDLNRPSLKLQTMKLPGQAERMAWLAEQVPLLPGHGIIYTLTVRDAVRLARWLQSRGIPVESYAAESEDREKLEEALLGNRVKALVATVALGMGFDKPDLAFVIHYQCPASVVAYYQQVGRAGRALEKAYGILLSGDEDTDITEYFIQTAFPTREEVEKILDLLDSSPNGLSLYEMMAKLNISMGRINKTLSLLSLETPSPVIKQGPKWKLTIANLSQEFWARAERLTSLRKQEKSRMQEYVELETGHMEFLIKELDGVPGKIVPPNLPSLSQKVSMPLVQGAVSFLRRMTLEIEPRKQWPTGGLPQYGLKGKIDENLRAQPGKALCVWRDAGWGQIIYKSKYEDHHFSDELVNACAQMIKEWGIKPAWGTCIPSLRHIGLVPDFTLRLANRIGVPFHSVIVKTCERPEQMTMQNSSQQAINVDGSLAINVKSLPKGAVMLVDDLVDSRWTITVATWLLHANGCSEVYPLALASTGFDY